MLDALAEYHRLDRYGFTPPGHRQGRGIDSRVRMVMGSDPFRDDVLVSSGLDDRSSSGGYLRLVEGLMADAVGAEHAFFSTCGSSLSVKAAMLAVAGHDGHLILSRDVHKSVVAGLVFSGVQPCGVTPRWDARLHIAHPPSPERIAEAWERYPQAAGALIVSPTPYGTCADITAIASALHERSGERLRAIEEAFPTASRSRVLLAGTPTSSQGPRNRWGTEIAARFGTHRAAGSRGCRRPAGAGRFGASIGKDTVITKLPFIALFGAPLHRLAGRVTTASADHKTPASSGAGGSQVPPRWRPGAHGKGVVLADHELVIWRVDSGDEGRPLHDTVAGMLGYDPVRIAIRLWIGPQGRVRTLAERAAPRPEALLERMQHHHPQLRLINDDAGARAGRDRR